MWFNNVGERIIALIGATIVMVVFILANPFGMTSYPRSTAPYQGTAGGGGTTAPPDPTPDPTPPPGGAGDKVIWAAGDNCDDDVTSTQTNTTEGCKHVGDMIKADNVTARVLILGDSQYEEGEAANFNAYYNVGMGKQQIFSGTSDSIWDRTIAAVGNHEYGTSNATPYYNYFGTVRSGDPDEGYFMTDLGKWRVISLNSNCSEVGGCGTGNPQGIWAAGALAAATAAGDSTIVIYHHPPFTDGVAYAPGTTSGLALWQIAFDNGADIVLTGHDHQYQRFGPLSRTGTVSAGGPQFFVSGAGGKGNNGFSTLSGTDRTLFEWGKQADGSQREPGALRLVVKDDGTYTFQWKSAVAGVGTTRDSGSGTSR